jgi:glycosyltransferase involved in cell wall biosynthesis
MYIRNESNLQYMKVLHFITSIDKTAGGTTVYMQLLSTELKSLVDLVVVTGLSPNPVYLKDVQVQFFDLSLNRWYSLAREFREFLEVNQPDIVHINGIWNPQCWLFQKVAQDLGIKIVLSPHGMLEPYILHRHPLKKKLALALYQHRALRNVDYYHTTAQSELDQVRKLGYTQTAVVIANGIETTDVLLKTEWKAVRNLLFLSRVHPKKGIDLLIEAVAQLPVNTLQITIAGEGDAAYVEELKRLAIQRNVAHQFHFVGGVYGQQKWELYQQSDLFVLPTYSENFGIVVPEALYTGLPVLTTTGTPWQELETEKCGWWIDLSVDNLAKALTEAIHTDTVELKSMGERGRKLVMSKYDVKEVAEKMKYFYQGVVNR